MYNDDVMTACGLLSAGVGMTADGLLGKLAAVAAIIHAVVLLGRTCVKIIKAVMKWRAGKATTKETVETIVNAVEDFADAVDVVSRETDEREEQSNEFSECD